MMASRDFYGGRSRFIFALGVTQGNKDGVSLRFYFLSFGKNQDN